MFKLEKGILRYMNPENLIGRTIAGRFNITGIIGEGGMGTVYQATHKTLPRKFAIKILKEDLAKDPVFVERFRREAIAASRVVHPNVVYITDFGQLPEGHHYLVMEYLEGDSLEDAMDRQGRLPLTRALHILIQLSDALYHAHLSGVVHRDLKLENILLCNIRQHSDVVKLVDFGIAIIVDGDKESRKKATIKGQVFGTPEYMSPEQAMDRPQDGRSDIYSLGILAFELIVGEPPFLGEPTEILHAHLQRQPPIPSSELPGVSIPSAFDACVMKCLAKKPEQRYPDAATLRGAFMKIRGLLTGMNKEMNVTGDSYQHPAFDLQNQGPWRSIGDTTEKSLGLIDPAFGEDLPQATTPHVENRDTLHEVTLSTNELRAQYHQTLKELAFSLGESAIRSDQMTQLLNGLLQLEEEEAALRGQVALMEGNFERIRFETGDLETMLRHAILDLTLERTRLLDKCPNPNSQIRKKAQDLQYQIDELQTRLEDVLKERSEKIKALNNEIQDFRNAREQKAWETAEVYARLHEVVVKVRDRATGMKLKKLYERSDMLLEKLESRRRSATTLNV